MASLEELAAPLRLSLLGLLISLSWMALAWILAWKKSFLSLVDVVWALGVSGLALFYSVNDGAWHSKKVVALILVCTWSFRLGFHLASRLASHYPKEDRRYQELRSSWGKSLALKSFLFFLFQGASQIFFVFPFAALATALETQISTILFSVGVSISIVGLVGEAIADQQLKRFLIDARSSASQAGAVCDRGLWNYSRHPNYFFEWVVWCGFGLMGASTPAGAWALLAPALIWVLLLYVTGVPPAEASSLRSKGDQYRQYQARTNKFIPWFNKKGAS